ncbi:MAG: phytoene/squalene synthase family protein [Gammaproteobacteria bacterium]
MSGSCPSFKDPKSLTELSDHDFQAILLEGVSRTFALTIPQLPKPLYQPVANAYLLCRIVDTIEDEISLDAEQKKSFCSRFIEITETGRGAESFSRELAPLLSDRTIPAEHTLIRVVPRVIGITHKFDPDQINALAECIKTMAKGMPVFQAQDLNHGLPTMSDMDNYCYYVAGCVGEMLAKLFCHYSPEIAARREELLRLSVSFGQGLQMTNILKDIWDDAERGVCWLPQDIFTETGFDLTELTPETDDERFRLGLEHLISIAHKHLENALTYTQMIPAKESGIRNFCLWALGMAVLTLKKIKTNLDFKRSSQVKISRKSVKATILATRLTGRSNLLLSWLFELTGRGLKTPDWTYVPQSLKAKSAL